ncbi:MAG: N-acetylneuraminate synthase [Rhodospirillaceae bacterium]|jgi:sialic acid synthase SpsE|nr:N-acetylneuraminate synthase [Rhodospirillaceae bacterium]
MNKEITIGRHIIGLDHPTYFVADIAANHDGDLGRARKLIQLCAEAGANAAKFQNFSAKTIVSDYGFKAMQGQQSHQAKWAKSVSEVYEDASIPADWTIELEAECTKAGIDYFTAPYDLSMISELSKHVCAWKLGSGDITWHENIEAMAADGKPLLIATGAAAADEVHLAVAAALRHTDEIVLMQCNTNYTASLENFKHIALNVLKAYARAYPGMILGLSDHTPGHATVLGAVALGARVIEKHFTDDVNGIGPDHGFSMDPVTWKDMVDRTRELELALGPEEKMVMENERDTVIIQRRAIRSCKALKRGDVLKEADLTYLRPCPSDALAPYQAAEILGKTLKHDIDDGDCVRATDLA